MSLLDYINEVLWGRLGRLCVGLVFFMSTLLSVFAYTNAVPINMVLFFWLGPPVLYQTITLLAALALWFTTKDWI